MSAPNAAGAGLTSPTPLSPSWLVRRSALLRSPDCASASPEPVKAADVSDDRLFRNVILLSFLRHGARNVERSGLFSPFGSRRHYTTEPKKGVSFFRRPGSNRGAFHIRGTARSEMGCELGQRAVRTYERRLVEAASTETASGSASR